MTRWHERPTWKRRSRRDRIGQDSVVAEESDTAEDYFRSRGFEVQVVERDLHSEHMAAGEPGRASFFAEGRRYFCVDLLRDGKVIAPRYADGESREAAEEHARREGFAVRVIDPYREEMLTADLQSKRINLVVVEGSVLRAGVF